MSSIPLAALAWLLAKQDVVDKVTDSVTNTAGGFWDRLRSGDINAISIVMVGGLVLVALGAAYYFKSRW